MKQEKKLRKFAGFMVVIMAIILGSLKATPVYANDFTNASTLSLNGQWSSKCVLAKNTTDYYKFTISNAGSVNLKVMTYINHDFKYTIYDSDYNEIDGSWIRGGSESSPEVVSETYILSQGTYYISYMSVSGATGNYKVYGNFESYGITAVENDSYDLPQNMSVDKKIIGAMTYTNMVDWYKITVPTTGKYRQFFYAFYPNTDNVGGSEQIICTLYDVDLSKKASVDIWATDSGSTETTDIELSAGTYYVKVAKDAFSSDLCGKYTYQLNSVIPVKGEILTDTATQAQYKVTKSGKTGGTVAYYKPTNGTKRSISIPATVKFDGITYKVTSVSANAFKGNSTITKVVIGKNVETIGSGAFNGCTKLKTVTFKSNSVLSKINNRAFYNCKKLSNIVIPSKITNIGKQAFANCSNLKSITIKTAKLNTSKVGANAFKGIHKKATIKVPRSKFSTYKKMLKKKGISSKVTIKKMS